MKRILAAILTIALLTTLFCGMTFEASAATILMRGIDVSYYQGDIDWSKVRNDVNGDFVILRAGYTGYGSKVPYADTCWEANYTGAKAAGIPVGVYYYMAATTMDQAATEVNFLLGLLNGKQFEFPIFLDVECEQVYPAIGRDLTTQIVKYEAEVLENAGYLVGVYTYTNFSQNYINMGSLTEYTTWIADYRTSCGYTGTYAMWQYSSTGTVSGISGDVDLNYCYVSWYESVSKNQGFSNFDAYGKTVPAVQADGSAFVVDGETAAPFNTYLSSDISFWNPTEISLTTGLTGNALKMNCTSPADNRNGIGGMAFMTFSTSTDLSGYETFVMDLYVSRDLVGKHTFQINFTSAGQSGYNYDIVADNWTAGWRKIAFKLNSISVADTSANWKDIRNVRFAWINTENTDAETYFLIDNAKLSPTHTCGGGTATCVLPETCSICGIVYGSVNPDNHVNTEIRNAVEATEQDSGYTGDTFCLDCQTIIVYGTEIPQLTPSVKYGDVNGDTEVSAEDALVALQSSVNKITLTDAQILVSDVDNVEGVTANDALLILQKAVNKIKLFPVEQ